MTNIDQLKKQTIGIEIELTGLSREKAACVLGDFFGTTAKYIGGTYRAYNITDGKNRVWQIMRDSSIRPERKEKGRLVYAGDEYKVEVVSPILHYEDIEELQEIVRTLRRNGAMANSSTGIHVHVGAQKFTPKTLRNIVNIVASKEDILYRALQVDENRIGYCKKTNERLLQAINAHKPQTMEALKELWYREDPYNTNYHYNNTRYHGLNLHATFTKGTVEFRLFNSTTHAGEVKAYIQLCLAIVNQALTQKRALARRTVTENEKYAFRCWLLRLGLIGDEFKTCRLHLLKHLEGNSAWRLPQAA